jgi:hypothetical protein
MAAFRPAVSSGQAHGSRNNATLACEHLEKLTQLVMQRGWRRHVHEVVHRAHLPGAPRAPVRFALPPIEKPADVPAAIQSVMASAAEGADHAVGGREVGPPAGDGDRDGREQYCAGTVEGRDKSLDKYPIDPSVRVIEISEIRD